MNDNKELGNPFEMIDVVINRLDKDLKQAATASLLNKDQEAKLEIIMAICAEQARRLKG